LLLTRFRKPFHPELFLAFSGFFRRKEAGEGGFLRFPPFSGFFFFQPETPENLDKSPVSRFAGFLGQKEADLSLFSIALQMSISVQPEGINVVSSGCSTLHIK